jgi:hypothetical protein
MGDVLLNLSTRLKEPAKFKVDGQEYSILGIDHLSPAEEAEVMALFARHSVLQDELSMTKTTVKGARIASQMKETREALLGKLTDLPSDVVRALAVSKQVKLLEVIEAVVSDDDDAEDAPDS